VARSKKDLELDDRARELIEAQLGGRGKFTLLESMSGISMSQWKNFFYGKQSLNDQMLAFLRKQYPHDEQWLLTGTPSPKQSSFPFFAPVPKASECMTVGSRLTWVIREFTSLTGDGLFRYLSSKRVVKSTYPNISPEDWKEVVLGLKEPSPAMIAVVCEMRPYFTSWVILGHAIYDQVDPTSEESIAKWKNANPLMARSGESIAHLPISEQARALAEKLSKSNGNKKS